MAGLAGKPNRDGAVLPETAWYRRIDAGLPRVRRCDQDGSGSGWNGDPARQCRRSSRGRAARSRSRAVIPDPSGILAADAGAHRV